MRDSEFSISRSEHLRYLGYKGQPLEPELLKRLDAMAARCVQCSTPRYCYHLFNIRETDDGVMLTGTSVTLTGNSIRKFLRGADKCAILAATLGIGVERELLRLETLSVTDALLFNAACTVLIEEAADRCQEEIAAKTMCVISGRFSPGYGDLPLSLQPEILALSGADKILGLRLTDGDLMVPRKSITAITPLRKATDDL